MQTYKELCCFFVNELLNAVNYLLKNNVPVINEINFDSWIGK